MKDLKEALKEAQRYRTNYLQLYISGGNSEVSEQEAFGKWKYYEGLVQGLTVALA